MSAPAYPSKFALGIVILGAGRSSRMGRPKLLLPWGNTSVLGRLVQQWRELRAVQIAVVRAKGDRAIASELDRLGIGRENRIANPCPEEGMFSSIKTAAQWRGWQPGLSHWVIVLGDQPHLRCETLRALVAFSEQRREAICQPSRGGRARHPVLLPGKVFAELASTRAATLREFLAGRQAALCEVDDPGLDLDLDRPEDYARALELAGRNNEPGKREKSLRRHHGQGPCPF